MCLCTEKREYGKDNDSWGRSWGIAIAALLHKNGHEITVWSALEAEVEMLREKHEHKCFPA